MRVVISALAMLLLAATAAEAQVAVRGHYRSDGTYVAPHYRSSPNSTTGDNYSAPRSSPSYTPAPTQAPATSSRNDCSGYSCYGQPSTANGQPRTTVVQGYTRRDGTYVAPYVRSNPQ